MTYQAPAKDMLFVMSELAGLDNVAKLPGFKDTTADTAQTVLGGSARFTGKAAAPLNVEGGRNPSSQKDDIVMAIAGFRGAFAQFGQSGQQDMRHPLEYGDQDLPELIAAAYIEMPNTANLSFALCPLLTDGAIEVLLTAGTEEQKQLFVPKLISGEWTGTMNLTESQAGSDLTLVHTRAEPVDDGAFKIFDTKVFITWGEHDMAENIVHLVLAHTSGTPEGVKGISLFVVLKFMVNLDGSLGARDDVYCTSIEHKLGIKASPTTVLQFGDNGDAIRTLVDEENRDLEYMFIVMNAARYAVGMQGIDVSERTYQKAVVYARDHVQNRPADDSAAKAVPTIYHPDVKRMLLAVRAITEGTRTLAYVAAAAYDAGHHSADDATREQNAALYGFLMPIVRGWSTEMSIDMTGLGMQVHGDMDSIEETGAVQFYHNTRILPIYEGTTTIQADDLIDRRTVHDGGAVALGICAEIAKVEMALAAKGDTHCGVMHVHPAADRKAPESVARFVIERTKVQPNTVFAGSVSHLRLCGVVLLDWQITRVPLVVVDRGSEDPNFYGAKIATARVFADVLSTQTPGIVQSILAGGETVGTVPETQF